MHRRSELWADNSWFMQHDNASSHTGLVFHDFFFEDEEIDLEKQIKHFEINKIPNFLSNFVAIDVTASKKSTCDKKQADKQ